MDAQHTLATVTLVAASVTAVGYLGRTFARVTRRLLGVSDVILGNEQSGHPSLAARLDAIEHELHPNSSLSLRDAIDRVERETKSLRTEIRRNATASRKRREQDREVIDRLAARVDALWQQQ